jgi:hypothetical protein
MTFIGGSGPGPQNTPRDPQVSTTRARHLALRLPPSPTLGTSQKRVNGDGPPKGERQYPCGRTGGGATCHRKLIRWRSKSRAVGGGSSSTKVFDSTSDGGDSYTLSPEPPGHGAGLGRWPDRDRLQRRRATLTFGTAPANGAAIVAWDIGGGGAPYDIGVYFPGQAEAGATLIQLVASRAFMLSADLTFAATASTATFSFASEVAFAAGAAAAKMEIRAFRSC